MEQGQLLNHLFERLDQTANLLSEHENVTYLEGLCLTVNNIINATIKQEDLIEQLEPLYDDFFVEGMMGEDVRRAFQLALLKGMKESSQPQHQITPDGIAIFMSYLIDKLSLPTAYSLLDPVVGTGNLLSTVLNHINQRPETVFGVEIDELLIKLAQANIELQQQEVQLFHQDVLRPLMITPVDLAIADLPVGTYFNKEYSNGFRLGKTEEPYSHYLIMEQTLKYIKPSGYFIALIPNNLFESDDDGSLHELIKDETYVIGLLELPESTFKDSRHAKSILILQKKDDGLEQPEHALLAKLPSFSDRQGMANMVSKIDDWFKEQR